jgi:hypothetical protein
MEQESVMETATTAGAGAMITAPFWLQAITPYMQFVAVAMGVAWIAMQMYYKVRNERDKRKNARPHQTHRSGH